MNDSFSDLFPLHPREYRNILIIPVLREVDYCPHCLCHPCVILIPPDFLVGTCGPHPAIDERRHRLYRKFWRLLLDLGVWNDEDYLRRKEARTSCLDKREFIPSCIIQVR